MVVLSPGDDQTVQVGQFLGQADFHRLYPQPPQKVYVLSKGTLKREDPNFHRGLPAPRG